ncbi:MAG TPA: hypothetical protein VHX37_00595 [Acidobacteriaceae bacterium]|jgi:hypothetical protein|nr:hypothetical protein [Acidobacteriaceae bacterium]
MIPLHRFHHRLHRADLREVALATVALALCGVAAQVPVTGALASALNLITDLSVTSATVALFAFVLPLADCVKGH